MFTDLLPHTLVAYRRPTGSYPTGVDRLGNPVEADVTGTANFTGPCRMAISKGGKQNNERMEQVFENRWSVWLEAGSDVREDDLIKVSDAGGNVLLDVGRVQSRYDVFAGTLEVHHVELDVWQQTTPGDAPGL